MSQKRKDLPKKGKKRRDIRILNDDGFKEEKAWGEKRHVAPNQTLLNFPIGKKGKKKKTKGEGGN